MPTKTQIRLSSRMSVRGERCAYLEGSAYLLDFRFFAGRGEEEVEAEVEEKADAATITAGRVRFEERVAEDAGLATREDFEVVPYWNFDNVPLKDAVGGGVESEISSDETSISPCGA